jgi:hypothetical protein
MDMEENVMAKKHHMTKHQYKAYEKKHRSRKYDDDDFLEAKLSGKIDKKHDGKLKNHFRHLHGTAAELLEDEFTEDDDIAEGE